MPDPERDSLSALTRYFVGSSSLHETLTEVCRASVEAIPVAEYAGISMTVDAQVGTYVFTDPEVVDIDLAQYHAGDGPCLRAYRTNEAVIIASVHGDGPFEEFRRRAATHGIGSVMSLPMHTGVDIVGALNFYAKPVHAFDQTAVDAGSAFAVQAAFLLANTKAYWDARTLSENLAEAMKSRAEIEQAKGMIMATTGVDSDEAFELLKRQSQHENIKLRDLAHELVNRRRPHPGS